MDRSPLVIYDETCRLCSGAVEFIKLRIPDLNTRFISMNSTQAKDLSESLGLSASIPDSLVFFDGRRTHAGADAAIRLIASLGIYYRFFLLLLLLPSCIKNKAYLMIARNRYRWFGTMP